MNTDHTKKKAEHMQQKHGEKQSTDVSIFERKNQESTFYRHERKKFEKLDGIWVKKKIRKRKHQAAHLTSWAKAYAQHINWAMQSEESEVNQWC